MEIYQAVVSMLEDRDITFNKYNMCRWKTPFVKAGKKKRKRIRSSRRTGSRTKQ